MRSKPGTMNWLFVHDKEAGHQRHFQLADSALTHDAKCIHIPWLGQAAVSEDFWGSVHDSAHMVACWHMLLTLLQGSAQPCTYRCVQLTLPV